MQRQQAIEKAIREAFDVVHLQVENESHMHSVPPNSETHFKVVLVTNDFSGMRKVARHQKVYGLLQGMMQEGLHALALHTYSPDEWAEQGAAPASPDCMGGSKHDQQ
ncbi:MAG: BolA/IbaG family iron-sulfur metabolism protein [Oleiphilaceae bacterium]|nr:BolA/IbaG family iron-sulfur metabolism protein [Oleiphilaceae bacterium]